MFTSKSGNIKTRTRKVQNWCRLKWSLKMKQWSSPQVEGAGVDAGAVRKQPVEHGGLPSHMERRQHQPSTRQPGLVADPMCQWRLFKNEKYQAAIPKSRHFRQLEPNWHWIFDTNTDIWEFISVNDYLIYIETQFFFLKKKKVQYVRLQTLASGSIIRIYLPG